MPCRKNERGSAAGHTLLEVMVVMGMLAILAAAAMQAWQGLVRRQQRGEARAALMAVMLQQERHYARHGRYQPFDAAAPGAFRWHSGPTPASSAYALSAVACDGLPLERCVTAVAQPGGAGVAAGNGDPACGALRLDSRGLQQADGGAACW